MNHRTTKMGRPIWRQWVDSLTHFDRVKLVLCQEALSFSMLTPLLLSARAGPNLPEFTWGVFSIFRYRLGKLFPSVELSEDAAMREAEEVSAMESTRREATGKRTGQKQWATVRQFQESLAADLKDLFPDDAERDDGGKDEFGRVWISKNIREIPRKFSDVRLNSVDSNFMATAPQWSANPLCNYLYKLRKKRRQNLDLGREFG